MPYIFNRIFYNTQYDPNRQLVSVGHHRRLDYVSVVVSMSVKTTFSVKLVLSVPLFQKKVLVFSA